MTQDTVQAIAHPTDFSEASFEAFAHALRLALEYRCRLDILHVRSLTGNEEWASFPRVRETLARWGLLSRDAAPSEIEEKLGVKVRKIAIEHRDPSQGVAGFLIAHRSDLVVMATRGAQRLNLWLSDSISADIAQNTQMPALFLGPKARPFVDSKTGALHLRNLVVPVAHHPAPQRALSLLNRLFAKFPVNQRFVHAGGASFELTGPAGEPLNVHTLDGPIVETIVSAANTLLADLLAMPTEGRNGFLDALRGSTTEQVLQRAPCPVLALPA